MVLERVRVGAPIPPPIILGVPLPTILDELPPILVELPPMVLTVVVGSLYALMVLVVVTGDDIVL